MTKSTKRAKAIAVTGGIYKTTKAIIIGVATVTVAFALIFTLFFGADTLVGETYDRTGEVFSPEGKGIKTLDPITNSQEPERMEFQRSETDADKSDKLDEVHNKNLKEAEERSMK